LAAEIAKTGAFTPERDPRTGTDMPDRGSNADIAEAVIGTSGFKIQVPD
jgi:hypothetical protein